MWAMARNGIKWNNYVSLGVNNTSVNTGRTNSVKVEARKENMLILAFPVRWLILTQADQHKYLWCGRAPC